jgi:alkylhydroperoxidase family enzyme
MALLTPIDPNAATGETKQMFDALDRGIGRVPTMIRLMAHSPAILETYLHFNHAFERTSLSPRTRALITVAIAELSGCDYMLSIGMALGRQQGVAAADLDAARAGRASDSKTAATLQFVTNIVCHGAHVPSDEVERLRQGGFSEAEIVDIIAAVALNIFRNYFNLTLATEIDSPIVRTGEPTPVA